MDNSQPSPKVFIKKIMMDTMDAVQRLDVGGERGKNKETPFLKV